MISLRPEIPTLYYDGDCDFCRLWIDYWSRLTGDAVQCIPFQSVAGDIPDMEEFRRAMQLIMPDGTRRSGAGAALTILRIAGYHRWLALLYGRAAWFRHLSELIYRFIARHRNGAYRVTKLAWGVPVPRSTYRHTRQLFLRGLGLIFLIAFLSLSVQITGLVGSDGILPASRFLELVRTQFGDRGVMLFPTLAWLRSTDAFLHILCYAGIVSAIFLILGVFPRFAAIALWAIYFSLYMVGQDFLSFQWDILLLETGFLAIAIAPVRSLRYSAIREFTGLLWLPRLLLFRLMFQSGVVKLTAHDPHWLDLTALKYHFVTQCIPTPLAWYADHLPDWILAALVILMFVVELVVPFLIFAPRRIRFAGGWMLIIFQLIIALTGNYTFFNYLTIVLCVTLFDDRALAAIVPRTIRQWFRKGRGEIHAVRSLHLPGTVFAAIMVALNVIHLAALFVDPFDMPAPVREAYRWSSHYSIVSSYGLFRVMTTSRPEIIIEGSNDGREWKPYEFRYKVGDTLRAPPWVAPHQPRLDWQMWFAALGDYRSNDWFVPFIGRLLEGSPDVLNLLARNPFPHSPPRYIRALLYDYAYSSPGVRSATGAWWERRYLGRYLPVVSAQ
jgi:predicted DCC family thiol-disulfide oxidoreductase YuxK